MIVVLVGGETSLGREELVTYWTFNVLVSDTVHVAGVHLEVKHLERIWWNHGSWGYHGQTLLKWIQIQRIERILL